MIPAPSPAGEGGSPQANRVRDLRTSSRALSNALGHAPGALSFPPTTFAMLRLHHPFGVSRPMNKTIAARVLLVVSLGLVALSAACNTVEGAGKDLQEASQNTKEALSN